MAKKMTQAQKDALHWLYCRAVGKRVPRGINEPSDATLDSLEKRGFVKTLASGGVTTSPWGYNVGKMIAGDM